MARVDKQCVICGGSFSVIPSRAKSAKTCGSVCRGKFIAKKYEDFRVKLSCKACDTVFSVPKCHATRRVYCSMSCADAHRNDDMPRGEDNWNWKGGKTTHQNGYIYMISHDHPFSRHSHYVFEHRLVTEDRMRDECPNHKFLIEVDGIKYLRTEVQVHHIDLNKQNNSPENLLACTPAAHRAIHEGGAPVTGEVWPAIEGTVSERKPFDIKFKLH